jgi:hypothetical protein
MAFIISFNQDQFSIMSDWSKTTELYNQQKKEAEARNNAALNARQKKTHKHSNKNLWTNKNVRRVYDPSEKVSEPRDPSLFY